MMNPKYFKNPDIFIPDRFLKDDKFCRDLRVCAFSVGLRNCVGKQLADEEYFQFAAEIIRMFRVKADRIDFTPAQTFSLLQASIRNLFFIFLQLIMLQNLEYLPSFAK